MNRDRYHAAFDGIPFRREFEEETVQLLLEAAEQQQEKECSPMKTKHIKKTALIAAVLAAAVMATAAAVNLLHPAQVAEYMGHPELADAFNSENAILLNESQPFGDYTFTVMGVVNGTGLSAIYDEAESTHSYIVAAMTRTDGGVLEGWSDGAFQQVMVTPLISGYQPWTFNIFTLGGSMEGILGKDQRTAFFLYDCENLDPFADHTIYLAVYEGLAPGSDMLQMAQDGSISFLDSYAGPHAFFTLPLDSAKADPEKAAAIISQIRQPGPEGSPSVPEGDGAENVTADTVLSQQP